MVSLETWWVLFSSNSFKPAKKSQIRYCPLSGQKHAKFGDKYLNINFALFNPHHNKTPFWAWKCIFEGFTSRLRQVILLWVNFQGHDEPLKITKIRFLKILNYAHFFNPANSLPGKTPKHLKFWRFERGNVSVKPGIKIIFGLFISAEY